ncbi:tRNA nucleotidyltransferase (CCA-adding enzyme) [Oxalobacteraceae bacterium GrIS 2.11]
MMKTYRVGGAVRDTLLGIAVKDVDYVVVGSSPEQMLAAGFTPVGKDFPVFLHPDSKEEYALARTERKSAPGYHGFIFHCSPDVTLDQDLQRRDLTINAMAVADDVNADQSIIDPFGGQRDLADKVLRHVSEAFSEDPVRILRLARFAARFEQFSVAPETMRLMSAMVESGEVDALVPERVWQELARGLMETRPSRMLQILHDTGALKRILPEIDQYIDCVDTPLLRSVDFAAQQQQSLAVRWATLCVEISHRDDARIDSVLGISNRLKLPTEVRDIAFTACREYRNLKHIADMSAEMLVNFIERCDALRRPARFIETLQAIRCHYLLTPRDFPQQALLEQALLAMQSISNGAIAQRVSQQFPNQPHRIAEYIFEARVAAVRHLTGHK